MIQALLKALGQLPDRTFRRVVFGSFFLSLALFAALVYGTSWLLDGLGVFGIGWLDWIVEALGSTAAFIVAVLLFPGIALVIVSLFLEPIVRAVEARHYPGRPPGRNQPIAETLVNVIRLVLISVILNLLALPLYLIPILNLFVFYFLNGYLLGREYFELVAFRRMGVGEARILRKQRKGRVFIGGVVITVLLSIPIISWMMPVVAVAFMVHLFEGLRSRDTAS
ncbi:MAG: EI24 domain-containing protein [Rhodospirillales bacterium]|nr:EI24 domain-containing protein [Rhodospirillales bacterium]